jgi:selenide,water dikinase
LHPDAVPPVRDLLLLGGGHAHVEVLRSLAMRRWRGVRVTLVSREVHTPYSGMLPGLVAGHYDFDDAHIDLGPLCIAAGARLIVDAASRLDLGSGHVHFGARPPLRFDVLSLDVGGVPDEGGVRLGPTVVPVKPISTFLPGWQRLLAALAAGGDGEASSLVVVGGGAGGVELALAVRHALRREAFRCSVSLVAAGPRLLEGHARRVERRLRRQLGQRGIEVALDFEVAAVDAGEVTARDGRRLQASHVLWVTGVVAPAWLASSGLAQDARGFVCVDETLRSRSHDRVFAAGDIAALAAPRPKAGVFAVRAGPVLSHNLEAALLGGRLRPFRPQRRFLSLISEGEQRAVASRGPFVAEGAWVWRWKDRIDRRFVARFRMPVTPAPTATLPRALASDAPDSQRCGGCGAKLAADLLARVLARLEVPHADELELGVGDDAAVLRATGRVLVTVDAFRAMVDDLYRFGRIAAHHALGDVYAMGGRPRAALALVTVPLAAEAMMEEDLFQLMRGTVDVLRAERVALAGGHSSEGLELALGFAVLGDLDGASTSLWRKSALRDGDALVLTKALGTGVVLAGRMRGVARSRDVMAALAAMDRSNREAVAVLREHGASTATDVTGFGLLGHLSELLRASALAAELALSRVPVLPGALELVAAGVESALAPANARVLADFDTSSVESRPRLRLLIDPQTSGGLLAGVPVSRADSCVQELRALGFDAAVVGHAHARLSPGTGRIDERG